MMSDAFRQELRKFDAQRVLPAWDGLVAKQQAKLEALGIPSMFPATLKSDREVSRAGWIIIVLGCNLIRLDCKCSASRELYKCSWGLPVTTTHDHLLVRSLVTVRLVLP